MGPGALERVLNGAGALPPVDLEDGLTPEESAALARLRERARPAPPLTLEEALACREWAPGHLSGGHYYPLGTHGHSELVQSGELTCRTCVTRRVMEEAGLVPRYTRWPARRVAKVASRVALIVALGCGLGWFVGVLAGHPLLGALLFWPVGALIVGVILLLRWIFSGENVERAYRVPRDAVDRTVRLADERRVR